MRGIRHGQRFQRFGDAHVFRPVVQLVDHQRVAVALAHGLHILRDARHAGQRISAPVVPGREPPRLRERPPVVRRRGRRVLRVVVPVARLDAQCEARILGPGLGDLPIPVGRLPRGRAGLAPPGQGHIAQRPCDGAVLGPLRAQVNAAREDRARQQHRVHAERRQRRAARRHGARESPFELPHEIGAGHECQLRRSPLSQHREEPRQPLARMRRQRFALRPRHGPREAPLGGDQGDHDQRQNPEHGVGDEPHRRHEQQCARHREHHLRARVAIEERQVHHLAAVERHQRQQVQVVQHQHHHRHLKHERIPALPPPPEQRVAHHDPGHGPQQRHDHPLMGLRLVLAAHGGGAEEGNEQDLQIAIAEEPHPERVAQLVEEQHPQQDQHELPREHHPEGHAEQRHARQKDRRLGHPTQRLARLARPQVPVGRHLRLGRNTRITVAPGRELRVDPPRHASALAAQHLPHVAQRPGRKERVLLPPALLVAAGLNPPALDQRLHVLLVGARRARHVEIGGRGDPLRPGVGPLCSLQVRPELRLQGLGVRIHQLRPGNLAQDQVTPAVHRNQQGSVGVDAPEPHLAPRHLRGVQGGRDDRQGALARMHVHALPPPRVLVGEQVVLAQAEQRREPELPQAPPRRLEHRIQIPGQLRAGHQLHPRPPQPQAQQRPHHRRQHGQHQHHAEAGEPVDVYKETGIHECPDGEASPSNEGTKA